jgi:hypothetical protein
MLGAQIRMVVDMIANLVFERRNLLRQYRDDLLDRDTRQGRGDRQAIGLLREHVIQRIDSGLQRLPFAPLRRWRLVDEPTEARNQPRINPIGLGALEHNLRYHRRTPVNAHLPLATVRDPNWNKLTLHRRKVG